MEARRQNRQAPCNQSRRDLRSFDVELKKDGELVQVDNHSEGGTHVLGGTTDAELNVTYNYSGHFFREFHSGLGLRWLNGKKAVDCVSRLESAVKALGVERDSDYWADTPGNAGYALSILLDWAKQHPDAVFEVS